MLLIYQALLYKLNLICAEVIELVLIICTNNINKEESQMIDITRKEADMLRKAGRMNDVHMSSQSHKSR